jgi:hypothetical protein
LCRIWVNKRFGTVICTPSSYASSHISCVWKDSWLSRMWGPVARSEKAGPQCFCLYEYEYVHEPGKEGTAYVHMHTSETETMHFARKLFACDDSLQRYFYVFPTKRIPRRSAAAVCSSVSSFAELRTIEISGVTNRGALQMRQNSCLVFKAEQMRVSSTNN